ncbi:MAG: hypothetical protein ABFE01_02600 [Phycisphaerales bacterium]
MDDERTWEMVRATYCDSAVRQLQDGTPLKDVIAYLEGSIGVEALKHALSVALQQLCSGAEAR